MAGVVTKPYEVALPNNPAKLPEVALDERPRAAWEASNPLRTNLCKTCFYRPQNELLELIRRGTSDPEEALRSYRIGVPKTLHGDFV